MVSRDQKAIQNGLSAKGSYDIYGTEYEPHAIILRYAKKEDMKGDYNIRKD